MKGSELSTKCHQNVKCQLLNTANHCLQIGQCTDKAQSVLNGILSARYSIRLFPRRQLRDNRTLNNINIRHTEIVNIMFQIRKTE